MKLMYVIFYPKFKFIRVQPKKISSLLLDLEKSVLYNPEVDERAPGSPVNVARGNHLRPIDYEFSLLTEFAQMHKATIEVNTFSFQKCDSEIENLLNRKLVQLVSPHIASPDLCYWHDDNRFIVAKYFSNGSNFQEKGQEICSVLQGLAIKHSPDIGLAVNLHVKNYPDDGQLLMDLVAVSDANELDSKIVASTVSHQRSNNVDVVVIDDDELLSETLQIALRSRGHSVSVIPNGQRALEILSGDQIHRSIHPKVILLDLDLPGMSGSDLLRKIGLLPSADSIDVIVVSGRSSEEATLDVLSNGAVEFVQKPFSLPVLMQRVETRLGLSA